jgi:hypothetical protein
MAHNVFHQPTQHNPVRLEMLKNPRIMQMLTNLLKAGNLPENKNFNGAAYSDRTTRRRIHRAAYKVSVRGDVQRKVTKNVATKRHYTAAGL